MDPLRLRDYEELARAKLPAGVWDYVNGGSGAEATLRANREAFDRIGLLPRVLVDVSKCDPTTRLLGAPLASPLGVAPVAYCRLAHPEGEVAVAEAVGADALMVVSMFASRTLEDIARAATGPRWLQIYLMRQREAVLDLVRRAADAGFQAVVLTVDTPQVGRRLRDMRNGFVVPPDVRAVNLDATLMASSHKSRSGESAIERHSREQFDPTLTWSDVDWLRERSPLPLVLKGILRGQDAALAVAHGAAALIVSNHGGRQLDGAVATVDALPAVVDAVEGRCPVIVDGGVRSGGDVLKALALSADAVLVGRPVFWGLAASGRAGAAGVLRLIRDELDDAMVLAGCPTLADVDRSLVRRPPVS